jgi:hypothetical protein
VADKSNPFAPETDVEEFEFDITGVESKSIGAGYLPAGKWLCALKKWESGKANTGTTQLTWYWEAVNWSGNRDNVGKTGRTISYITAKTKEYFRGTLEAIGIPIVKKGDQEKAQFGPDCVGLLAFVVFKDEGYEVTKDDGTKETKIFTKGDHVETVPAAVREAYLRENNVTLKSA